MLCFFFRAGHTRYFATAAYTLHRVSSTLFKRGYWCSVYAGMLYEHCWLIQRGYNPVSTSKRSAHNSSRGEKIKMCDKNNNVKVGFRT